jgi:hypothetical protein
VQQPWHAVTFSRRGIWRPGCLTRSFSSEFKVSPVGGSGEQLILDNVDRMSDFVVISRMEIRKLKELVGKLIRKHPAFCFRLGKPNSDHSLNFCAFNYFCGRKLSFGVFL